MRIVTGKFKGREIISPPKNIMLRPTSDRVREAIFDVIRYDLQGKTFLDLFAGSGAVGIEAISEGASFAYFVEKNLYAVKTIRKNIINFGLVDCTKIIFADVLKFLSSGALDKLVDFVFLDPPYNSFYATATIQRLVHFRFVSRNGIVIVEHSIEEKVEERFTGFFDLIKSKEKTYGKIVVSFYMVDNYRTNKK